MFGWFKKTQFPEFTALQSSPIKDQYFYRTAHFHWMDEQHSQVCAMPPGQAKMVTMDDWPQVVFLDALGQQTVAEYTLRLARQYPRKEITSDFDKNILYQIDQLVDIECIALSDRPVRLASEFANPTTA